MPSMYKKLNLIALGGTLVYAYILSCIQQDDSLAVVSSVFTYPEDEASNNPNSGGRPRKLRAAAPPSSSFPKFVNGPVINHRQGKASTINLIGERHSGTNWITNHLVDCFGDQIEVQFNFTRTKHWFQIDNPKIRNESAVVVAMFRDPYDWVEAMRERPHHAHNHVNMEWKNFVSKPWGGSRGPADKAKMRKAKEEGKEVIDASCCAGYKFNEVIPCSREESPKIAGLSNYLYELKHDGSGQAYKSIIDLRRDKILNFLQVPEFHGVKAFFPERYEALKERGTSELLAQLEEITGLKAQCKPFTSTGAAKHKDVDPEYIIWMNKFVDWDVESLIGYTQREPLPRETMPVVI